MAEEVTRGYPQVFVVDSQSSYTPLPGRSSHIWKWLLFMLVGVALFGVVVEGLLIYYLYNRTEVGTAKGQRGHVDTKESYPVSPGRSCNVSGSNKRPAAHLSVVSEDPMGKDGVMRWNHQNGDVFIHDMKYENGGLRVKKPGYYYLYSKVLLNAVAECATVSHKVMKNISSYGEPLEIMTSHKLHCRGQRPSGEKNKMASAEFDLWNSFLGGVFELKLGDVIFVQLEGWEKTPLANKENYMGAFMIQK